MKSHRCTKAIPCLTAAIALTAIRPDIAAAAAPPFDGPYSDNSTITYRSIEAFEPDYLTYNHLIFFTMEGQYDDRTDLAVDPPLARRADLTYGASDDYYWYAADDALFAQAMTGGDWKCMKFVSGSTTKCDRSRLRINEDLVPTLPDGQKWQTICHEIGHGVGFGHGDTALGCMDGGNVGVLSDHEITKINGRY